MTEITAVNEAAKAQGMSYGQYVLQNEMPAEPPERAPEEETGEVILCAVCGKPVPLWDEEGNRSRKRMYCSKACRQKACRNRYNSREYWRKTHSERKEEAMGTGTQPVTGEIVTPEHDPVNHPSHYCQGGIECKDAIRAAVTGLEGYEGFLTGNAIKYLWRWKRKNGTEDLRKADFWIRELIEETEGKHEENT